MMREGNYSAPSFITAENETVVSQYPYLLDRGEKEKEDADKET